MAFPSTKGMMLNLPVKGVLDYPALDTDPTADIGFLVVSGTS